MVLLGKVLEPSTLKDKTLRQKELLRRIFRSTDRSRWKRSALSDGYRHYQRLGRLTGSYSTIY